MIAFDKSVPKEERAWISRLVNRFARVFGFEAWEFRIYCKRFRGDQIAECSVKAMSSIADITLHPGRMDNREGARADLAHELWHLLDDDLLATLDDLAAHIPDEKRRRRASRRAIRAYEKWHDRTARIVASVLL